MYKTLIAALIALLCVGCMGGGDNPTTNDEDLIKSRYLQGFADPDNGCEYFTTMDGGLYPRMNKDGSQFGCK